MNFVGFCLWKAPREEALASSLKGFKQHGAGQQERGEDQAADS